MKIMVLAAFYHGAGAQPMSLPQVITYTWLGQAFLVLLPWNADPDVAEMVRTGAVAYERLRPVDTYAYWYVRALAWTLARAIPRAVPMAILSGLVLPLVGLGAWSLRPPASLEGGVLFAVSITCAALLSTAFVQLITGLAVATLSPRGANAISPALANLLSGGIVPLLLFPAWMRGALFVQPFAGLVDIPFPHLSRPAEGEQGRWPAIALQLGWTLGSGAGRPAILDAARRGRRCKAAEWMNVDFASTAATPPSRCWARCSTRARSSSW